MLRRLPQQEGEGKQHGEQAPVAPNALLTPNFWIMITERNGTTPWPRACPAATIPIANPAPTGNQFPTMAMIGEKIAAAPNPARKISA